MQQRTNAVSRAGYWILLVSLLVIGHSSNYLDSDEGVVLHGAWSLWNGREPYSDFFEFTSPGSIYVVYWLWKLFGPHFVAAKLLAVLSLFSACVGIHLTGRLLTLNGFSYIGPVLYALASFGWPPINHHTFNIALLIWATYFFARSLSSAPLLMISASGLIAGISALFLQHKSAAVIMATAAFLLFLRLTDKRPVWLKGLGVYLLAAGAPLLILLNWPLGLLFDDLVYFPMSRYIPHAKVPLWPFYFACALLLGSMALLRGAANRVASYLMVVQAVLLLMSLQRTDYMHVSITFAPLLALLPYLYTRAMLGSFPNRFLFRFAFVLMAAVPVTMAAIVLPNARFFSMTAAPELMGFIREHCTESPYIYAGPFLPGMSYETRKLNATSFSFLITGFHTSEQFTQARQELELRKPACAVVNYAMVKKFNYDLNNPVDEFIQDNYRLAYTYGRVEVYVWDR